MERLHRNAELDASPAEAWAEAGEERCHSVGAERLGCTGDGRGACLGKPRQQIHHVTDSPLRLEVNC